MIMFDKGVGWTWMILSTALIMGGDWNAREVTGFWDINPVRLHFKKATCSTETCT